MAIVTIPFDYDLLPDSRRVVPICIEDTDRDGCLINRGWFEAVVPVADPLRNLSRRVLKDVWRVSEVTEISVHALWRKHRDNLGLRPSARILAHANWTADDLFAGGRNARRGVTVPLLDSIRCKLYTLPDAHNKLLVQEVRGMLRDYFAEHDADHIDAVVDMWASGMNWNEIAKVLGKSPKAATKDFWRWMGRALEHFNLR